MTKTIMIAGCLFILEHPVVQDGNDGYIIRDAMTQECGFIDTETLTDSQY